MINSKNILKAWKVLVVEDEPDSLEVAVRILGYYGAELATAKNGKEALEVLQNFSPKFIITDLSMPQMDGWALLYNLQQNRETAEIPVFALTAHAMLGDRERAMSAGFSNYLTKPLTPATFMQQLLSILEAIPEFEDYIKQFTSQV
jgi:two-component system cell cycle response regulator